MKRSLFLLALLGVAWGNAARAEELPARYREVVRKGLEYLSKQQHRDGQGRERSERLWRVRVAADAAAVGAIDQTDLVLAVAGGAATGRPERRLQKRLRIDVIMGAGMTSPAGWVLDGHEQRPDGGVVVRPRVRSDVCAPAGRRDGRR